MKKIIVTGLLLAAFAMSALAQDMMDKKSLFDRLGGQDAVTAVVADFAGRVLADARVNKKFARSDKARLVKNLTDFVCFATGGPCKYEGLSMKMSHKNMAVTDGEFNALAEDLVATLNQFKVPEKERTDLMNAVAPLAKDIVEKKGNKATGTDLPKKFKPAPPLKEGMMKKSM